MADAALICSACGGTPERSSFGSSNEITCMQVAKITCTCGLHVELTATCSEDIETLDDRLLVEWHRKV